MHPALLAGLAVLALAGPAAAAPAMPKLAFPLACHIGRDCEVQHYVDRDPGPGVLDYHCGHRTYDRHNGIDIRLLDMAQQRRGVDVLAAAPGKVIAVRDGVADVSIRAPGAPSIKGRECGNRVGIAIGGGWITDYCHLARGSVRVKVGDVVAAGQPVARVGLSGDTEFPHLHMSVQHGNIFVDPFEPDPAARACGVRAPLWDRAALAALRYKAGTVLNAGFAAQRVTMGQVEDGRLAAPTAAAPLLVAYARLIGLQAGDVIELKLAGPDGAVLAQTSLPPLPGDRDQDLAFVGRKRPAGGWAKGAYSAQVRVLRSGKPAIERRFGVRL
jgi:hypothetical protein